MFSTLKVEMGHFDPFLFYINVHHIMYNIHCCFYCQKYLFQKQKGTGTHLTMN